MLQVVIESYIAKCGDDVNNTQISTCIHIEDDMIDATKSSITLTSSSSNFFFPLAHPFYPFIVKGITQFYHFIS